MAMRRSRTAAVVSAVAVIFLLRPTRAYAQEFDFEYSCVTLAVPSTTDQAMELPSSLTEVSVGDTFYVEFWASDVGDANTGVVSAYTDLDYPEGCVVAGPVTPSPLFNLFPSGGDTGSMIDELGGSQLASGIGVEPEWARIAYVEFTASATCNPASFELLPATSESSAYNRGLIPTSDVSYNSCDVVVFDFCVVDADCDDDAYCNGAETCVDGACQLGDPPCPEEYCDEDTDTCEQPLSDFAYQCSIVALPSSSDQATELPSSLTEVSVGDTFYVEFWASDVGDANTGVVSAYTDLDYPEGCVVAGPVTPSPLFNLFPSGSDTGSMIDELGGSQLASGIGVEPEWARIAYVEFEASAECNPAVFDMLPASSESSAYNRGLVPESEISYGSCNVLITPPCSLVATRPPDCAIDARQISEPDGSRSAGWDSITFTFDGGCPAAVADDFVISHVPDHEPTLGIDGITFAGDDVIVHFTRMVGTSEWTCISYMPSGDAACLAHLPADANADTTSSAEDIGALIDNLSGANKPSLPAYQCNIDRSDVCGPTDVLRLVDLLNGAGEYAAWLNRTLDECPTIP